MRAPTSHPSPWLVGALVAALSACGASEPSLRGFPEVEARAAAIEPTPLEACAVKGGRLVIEVEAALVREYPHDRVFDASWRKQPLLLVWLTGSPGLTGDGELLPIAAPEEYHAGDRVRFFEGRRLLDRPLRALHGRRLDVRLAENHRSLAPRWTEVVKLGGAAFAGAASVVDVSAPSPAVVSAVVDLVRTLDRDGLILFWSVELDKLAARVDVSGERVLRFPLATTRRVPDGPARGLPSAELGLLVYVEPEPGCARAAP